MKWAVRNLITLTEFLGPTTKVVDIRASGQHVLYSSTSDTIPSIDNTVKAQHEPIEGVDRLTSHHPPPPRCY